jgi:hypothetical protein
MGAVMDERWHLTGQVLVACSCDWGCPCNFNARPTAGKCEGGWTWHVEDGSYMETRLDGLNFSVYVNWPGAIHEGNGEGVILIDERSTAGQRTAIERLVGGEVGGPWGVLAWTWPNLHGPHLVSYDLEMDGVRTRLKCGDHVEVECTAIRNPVSGAEVHPSVILPEGIILKRGELGMTTRFKVSTGIAYDHSGKYMAAGRFDYSFP